MSDKQLKLYRYRPMLFSSGWRFFTLVALAFTISSCREVNLLPTFASITFNTPSGGEVFVLEGSYNLSWNSSGVKMVDIDLIADGGISYKIADNLSNVDLFQWTISSAIPAEAEYTIRIYDSEDNTVFSELRQPLTLLSAFQRSIFLDERDGREYATVKVGDNWWMAENFSFETSTGSMYYNDVDSLGTIYGRLYTLEAAMENAPEGWHLPTDEEWISLEEFLGIKEAEINLEGSRSHYIGNLLKEDGGTGFNALYGGYYNTNANRCGHIFQEAHFWTSSYDLEDKPLIRVVSKFEDGIIRLGTLFHSGCSVRYVMDE